MWKVHRAAAAAAAGVNLQEQLMVGEKKEKREKRWEGLGEAGGGKTSRWGEAERGRRYCTHMKDTMYVYSNTSPPVQAQHRSDV